MDFTNVVLPAPDGAEITNNFEDAFIGNYQVHFYNSAPLFHQ